MSSLTKFSRKKFYENCCAVLLFPASWQLEGNILVFRNNWINIKLYHNKFARKQMESSTPWIFPSCQTTSVSKYVGKSQFACFQNVTILYKAKLIRYGLWSSWILRLAFCDAKCVAAAVGSFWTYICYSSETGRYPGKPNTQASRTLSLQKRYRFQTVIYRLCFTRLKTLETYWTGIVWFIFSKWFIIFTDSWKDFVSSFNTFHLLIICFSLFSTLLKLTIKYRKL
jgi:hypothetical protein